MKIKLSLKSTEPESFSDQDAYITKPFSIGSYVTISVQTPNLYSHNKIVNAISFVNVVSPKDVCISSPQNVYASKTYQGLAVTAKLGYKYDDVFFKRDKVLLDILRGNNALYPVRNIIWKVTAIYLCVDSRYIRIGCTKGLVWSYDLQMDISQLPYKFYDKEQGTLKTIRMIDGQFVRDMSGKSKRISCESTIPANSNFFY